MSDERRPHSRSGPAAAEGAAAGAQPFAREGQFTGEPIDAEKAREMRERDEQAAAARQQQQPPEGDPEVLHHGVEAAAETAAAAAGEQQAEDPLAAALRERDEFREDLQRLAAEFDNFRKRSRREVDAARQAAGDSLLVELLSVLDDIERAVAATGDSPEHQGFVMVRDRFRKVLADAGVSEVDPSGAFDPDRHEAVLMQPGSGQPDGTILEVAQRGYEVNGRVVRYPKVVVAGEAQ